MLDEKSPSDKMMLVLKEKKAKFPSEAW